MKKALIILSLVLASCSDKEAINRNNTVVDFATKPIDSLFVKYGKPTEDYSISFVDKKISTWYLTNKDSITKKVILIYKSEKREIIKEMRFHDFKFDIFPATELGWIDLDSKPIKLCNEEFDSFYKKTYYTEVEGVKKATYHHLSDILQIELDFISDETFKYQ